MVRIELLTKENFKIASLNHYDRKQDVKKYIEKRTENTFL